MSELFNVNVKEEFLKKYPKSEKQYRRIFIRSASKEKLLNIDLFEMSREDISDVMDDLNPPTETIAKSYGRIITSYITWAINEGYRKNNINPLKSVDNEWFFKFVDKSKKLYFSEDEIIAVENLCENPQDAVIIRLLFEGVNGIKDFTEIRTLHRNRINWNNNALKLLDYDKAERFVTVSDRCIEMIEDALDTTTYIKKNGYMEEVDGVRNYTELVDNDFVLRNSITKTQTFNEPVSPIVISRRLKTISDTLNIPYFTAKNIFRSGIIRDGKRLFDQYGSLGKEQYEELADKYRINYVYSLKEYCNEEVIDKLYSSEQSHAI